MKNIPSRIAERGKVLAKTTLPHPMIRWLRAQRQKIGHFQRRRQDRKHFLNHLRNTDIFLIGHPKSGNTWLAYMLAIILYRDIQDRINLSNIGEYVPVIHGWDSSISKYPNLSEPRAFRNEVPIYPERYPKVIYLIRNPRAVLASYYHMYCTIFDDHKTTMKAFVEEYLAQGCIKRWEKIERWDKQVTAWVKRADQDRRVIIVKYEDMVRDRQRILEEVIEFADIHCSQEILSLAVRRGDFNAMLEKERKHGAESYQGEVGKRGQFIRRGKIDGWKDEMDSLTIALVEEEFSPVIHAVGYSHSNE